MTDVFRYTLLADGTSDQVLMPMLDWLLREHMGDHRVVGSFARDFGPVGNDLSSRLGAAIRNFPCDLLFIHRDAEAASRDQRLNEIGGATQNMVVPYVPVIPVRMTETWLLAEESAIRFASGNSSGRMPLNLPARARWESLPDPKEVLMNALRVASGRSKRALDKFRPERARHLISPHIESFDNLRGIPSFDALEADLLNQLENIRNALD
jgi:hypothetical protein